MTQALQQKIFEYWNKRILGENLENTDYINHILRFLKQMARWKVLDIGCGRGRWIKALKARDIVGVDFAMKNCILTKASASCEVVCADARFLPFKSDSFNFVYAIQILGSFLETKLAIQEALRVTIPTGTFLFTFLNKLTPYSIISYLRKKFNLVPYVQRYTSGEVKSILSNYEIIILHLSITGIPLPRSLTSLLRPFKTYLGTDIIVVGRKMSGIDNDSMRDF